VETRRAVVVRLRGLTFAAKGDSNHWVVMDGPASFGGSEAAPRPIELLLVALGGCTASDVASILDKKRMDVRDLRVELRAEVNDEHPRTFRSVHIEYVVTGNAVDRHHVERAVELSTTKYCPIIAMLQPNVVVTHTCRINEVGDTHSENVIVDSSADVSLAGQTT